MVGFDEAQENFQSLRGEAERVQADDQYDNSVACATRTRGNRSYCRQKPEELSVRLSTGVVQDCANSWKTGSIHSAQHDK